MTLLYIAIAALLLLSAGLAMRSRRHRRRNPKDYGFSVYSEFGPTRRLPPIERLRRKISWIGEAELAGWVKEFGELDKLIWALAEQGGSKTLGRQEVERRLVAAYPYLESDGLRSALFLVDYYTWHEGYAE